MDPISTALTAAWLDAVRRVQSDRVQRLEEIMPDAKPAHDERGLTDAIERGLKSGGAAPLAVAQSEKRDGPDTGLTTRLLDVLV
jgi:hypothetical protein